MIFTSEYYERMKAEGLSDKEILAAAITEEVEPGDSEDAKAKDE